MLVSLQVTIVDSDEVSPHLINMARRFIRVEYRHLAKQPQLFIMYDETPGLILRVE